MKEGDLTTEQQAEMIAEASGWRRRALVAEAALKVSRAETEKAAQFAIAYATPPMRDREAIARLIARHSDVYEGMWPEHLGAADAILSLSPSPCDCLGEWVALTAERVLYVDKGKETILCDRLPSPITLVLKNPAHADGAYLPSADTGEFRIPLADRKGVSAAPCCLGVREALERIEALDEEELWGFPDRDTGDRPSFKTLDADTVKSIARTALQGHRGDGE